MSALFSVGGKVLNIGDPLTFGPGNPAQLSLAVRGNAYLPCVGTVETYCACWPIYSGGVGPLAITFANGTLQQNCAIANSGYFKIQNNSATSVNENYLYVLYVPGSTNQTQGDTDTIELLITDYQGSTATASFLVTYTTSYHLNLYVPDYILTNVNTSILYAGIGTWNCISVPNTATNFTFTPDADNYFTIVNGSWNAGNPPTIILTNDTDVPPVGSYTLAFGYSNPSYSTEITIYVTQNKGPNQIFFHQSVPTLSTSLPSGFIIGQVNATGDADNIYSWEIYSGNAYFGITQSGLIVLLEAPASASAQTFGVQVSDVEVSYQQTFTVSFVAGNVIASSNMTASIPTTLTNAVSSGTLTTPSVTGFTPKFWNFKINYGSTWQTAPTFAQVSSPASTSTSCGRYTMNNLNGQITIGVAENPPNGNDFPVVPLSYQVAGDGTSFEDELTIYATDFVNTCVGTFSVPVAAAVPSTNATYSIGPTSVLEANGINTTNINSASGTVFSTLTDAFTALGVGNDYPTTLEPGSTFVCYSYPQDNAAYKTYYENDGFINANGTAAGGTCGAITQYMPVTIMGAPGQPFPYFSATIQANGGVAGGMTKGFFYANAFDLTLKNLSVAFISFGPGVAGAIGGICKETGVISGNLTIHNCYIHDCCQGVYGGAAVGGKIFVTDSRISHCGIGEFGLSHNIYVHGDFSYVSNVQSDQAFVGHLLKSRAQTNIISDCTLIDGDLGCASNIIELPNGGVATLTNNTLQKGPNSQNPNMISYASNGDDTPPLGLPFDLTPNAIYSGGYVGTNSYNTLTASGNTLILDPGSDGYLTNPTNASGVAAEGSSCYAQSDIIGFFSGSLQGFNDGVAAVMNISRTSFYGLAETNYSATQTLNLPTTSPLGTTSLGTTTTLATRPSTSGFNAAFPGSGPNPTTGDPPGPFVNSWCATNIAAPSYPTTPAPLFNVAGQYYTGGGQFVTPAEPMTVQVGAAAGTVIGTVSWFGGESTATSPTFSIIGSQGPNENKFAINSSTGAISTTATMVAQTNPSNPVDTLSLQATQNGEQLYWSLTVITVS